MRLKTARNSSAAYLRSLLDAGSEGILVVRPDGVILDLTDSGARILGAATDSPSLIGRHLVDGGAVRVQTSVGIALSQTGDETAETLLRDADMAMYAAKGRGKGRYEYFDDKLRASATQKLQLRQALEQAVSDENFVLHYQPVVALATGELLGAEALLRWRTRNGGLRAPHAFLHLAEEAGLMDIIGRWALREACAAAQRWQALDGSPFHMAANLSARQLDQPGFAAEVDDVLGDTRFPAEGLTVEITE